MSRLLPVDTTFAVDTTETYWNNGVRLTRKYTGRTDGALVLSLSSERDETTGAIPAALPGCSLTLVESGSNTGVYTVTLDGTAVIAALGTHPKGTKIYEWSGFGANMNDGISLRVLVWDGL
jgi:hypothetical protein